MANAKPLVCERAQLLIDHAQECQTKVREFLLAHALDLRKLVKRLRCPRILLEYQP